MNKKQNRHDLEQLDVLHDSLLDWFGLIRTPLLILLLLWFLGYYGCRTTHSPPPPTPDDPMTISKSSALFQERAGLRPTLRTPAMTFDGRNHPVHSLSLPCPLPVPSLVSNGDPAPDRGLTVEPWPHGVRCEEEPTS